MSCGQAIPTEVASDSKRSICELRLLNDKSVSTKFLAEIIGDSMLPTLINMLCGKFARLSDGDLSDALSGSDA
jgi:hypothetical protein